MFLACGLNYHLFCILQHIYKNNLSKKQAENLKDIFPKQKYQLPKYT